MASICQAIIPLAPAVPLTSIFSSSAVMRCRTTDRSHGTVSSLRPGDTVRRALPLPTQTRLSR